MTPKLDTTGRLGRVAVVIALLAACAASALAQQPVVEITPTIGYRWGGELYSGEDFWQDSSIRLADQGCFGLVFGFPITPNFQLELMADHQEAERQTGGLFEPGSSEPGIEITYYHLGFLWQWNPPRVKPYIVTSFGVTDLDPQGRGLSSAQEFSASFGGGIKLPLSEHVALRLEVRLFGTHTADSAGDWDDDWWDDCDGYDCDWYWHHLFQSEFKVGVSFSF